MAANKKRNDIYMSQANRYKGSQYQGVQSQIERHVHPNTFSASGGSTTRHQSMCGSQFKELGKELNSKQDLP
jgi:hypothetical protein